MKLKLNIEDMTDGFFEDARLIGIVAPVKDYQLVRQLNNRLRFDFRSNHELEIQMTKKPTERMVKSGTFRNALFFT